MFLVVRYIEHSSVADRWKTMPFCHQISLTIKFIIFSLCLIFIFWGRPPALPEGITSSSLQQKFDDRDRDVQLGKLADFHTNQDNWNHEMALQVQELRQEVATNAAEIQSIEGWEKGGFGVLSGLSILAIFFQLKKKE
jgi:hypothetical protein